MQGTDHMSRRKPTEAECRAIARAHKPRGWKVVERPAPSDEWCEVGYVLWDYKKMVTTPIVNVDGLMTFLHECGHVHMKHGADSAPPPWEQEYEAERYAIEAARAAGVVVPRTIMVEARHNVQARLPADTTDVSARVLQFVYGRKWRDYR